MISPSPETGYNTWVITRSTAFLPPEPESVNHKTLRPSLFLQSFVVILLALAWTGCGSSSSSGTKTGSSPIAVTVAASSQSIFAGQTTTLTATTNDPKGVTWSLSGPGSLSGIAATSVTYNAPAANSTTQTATVTATSVTDPSKSQMTTITIGPAITVSAIASPTAISGGRSAALTVTTNDPKGVTWGLSSGTGTLSALAATSATYNAPTMVSSAFSASVTATSVSDSTKSATVTISVVATLAISTNLPPATFTVPYQGTVTVSGGVPPVTLTLSGALPTGLTYANGVISGTPIYPGNNGGSFSFTASDSANPPDSIQSATLSVQMILPTSFTILTTSLPSTTLGVSYNQQLYVTGGTPPYSYSISAGSLPPGLSLPTAPSAAITGTSTTAGTYNFTLKVTDFAIPPDVTTANLSITVLPPVRITTSSLPNGTVGMAYLETIQATGGQPPYSFNILSGGSPFNMNSVGAFGGVPSLTGTYPLTFQATDANGASGTAALTLNITAENCPNNGNFQGNYAFLFNGSYVAGVNSSTSGQFIGSFVADGNGNLTQGYVDTGEITNVGVTGTYCIGSGNLGTLAITTPSVPIPSPYLIQLDSAGNASATDFMDHYFDGLLPLASGTILKQDPTAFSTSKIVGDFAFTFLGNTFNQPQPQIQAGTLSADGAGNLTGEFDVNSVGAVSNSTFTASNLAIATFGRGTVTLTEPSGATVSVIFYVVNSSQLFALAEPPVTNLPVYIMTGPVVQSTGGPYTNSSLSGTSVIEQQSSVNSLNSGNNFVAQVGLISWDGAGNFTFTADQNQNGTLSAPTYSGTYSVSSDGRVTLAVSGQTSTPILYLSAPNQGFVMGTDTGTSFGQILSQSGSPFGSASFSGTYLGLNFPELDNLSPPPCGGAALELDNLVADGTGNLTGTSYQNTFFCFASWIPLTETYTVSSSGRGVVTQNGGTNNIFYVVSPTQVISMPATAAYPNVIMLSHP